MEAVGTYPFCNTGSVIVYDFDFTEDKILAGINDEEPKWCPMGEDLVGDLGFWLDEWFIPFDNVMRI